MHTLDHMTFLTELYAKNRLYNLPGISSSSSYPITRTERLRILRAFYRWQMVANVWAPTRDPDCSVYDEDEDVDGSDTDKWDRYRQALGFFYGLPVWLILQIDHISPFIFNLCQALHAEAKRIGQPIDEVTYGELCTRTDYLAEYLRANREITQAACEAILPVGFLGITPSTDPNRRRRSHSIGGHVSLYDRLDEKTFWQEVYREWDTARIGPTPELHPSMDPAQAEDEAPAETRPVRSASQRRRGTSVFRGDRFEDLSAAPFGWVDAMDGEDTRNFKVMLVVVWRRSPWGLTESELSRLKDRIALWRRMGMAFWDRERVEALKCEKMVGGEQLLDDYSTGWLL